MMVEYSLFLKAMRTSFVYTFLVLIFCNMVACKKTGFNTDPNASVTFSTDELNFDTVFTSVGSVTQSFKIFNNNDQKLRLDEIKLMGVNSSFKINVDGLPGTTFHQVEIEPEDSIYVFVSVNVPPDANPSSFEIKDSIQVRYNGRMRQVNLTAQAQNARFLRNVLVTTDTTWTADLPIVIFGQLTVQESATLTILPGSRIFCHADAPLIVDGNIQANGTLNQKIIFRGDRLDEPYKNFPAGWPGFVFNSLSLGNSLVHCEIRNAYQAITAAPVSEVFLDKCIIDNAYDAGIIASNAFITAENTLITNCGSNVVLLGGGGYSFTHCTLASFGNLYIQHKKPVLTISNFISGQQPNNLTCNFTNNIMWGEGGVVDNEIVVQRHSNTTGNFTVSFDGLLYKNKTALAGPGITLAGNILLSQNPQFDTIDVSKNRYRFNLAATSPAIDKGKPTPVINDIDDHLRDNNPDLGCYEFKP